MGDSTRTPEEIEKEAFEHRSAVTIGVLAAVLAFVTLFGGNATADGQMSATKAADSWALYQSRSLKAHTYSVERDAVAVFLPSAVDEAKRAAFMHDCQKQADKYAKEKEESRAEAEGFQKDVAIAAHVGDRCGYGSLQLQIAIVVASVAILVRKKLLWLTSVLLGLSGAITALTGILHH